MKKQNINIYKTYIIINLQNDINLKNFFKDLVNILKMNIKIIQLRYKGIDNFFFKHIAQEIKKICDEYKVILIINDNINIMYEINASGIHLGQNDLKFINFNELISSKKIIGISVKTLEQAVIAKNNGANYLGVGSIFNSNTKLDTSVIGITGLKKITYNINIPVIAIGGINFHNIHKLSQCNISGIAIISLLENSNNKKLTLQKLISEIDTIIYE